jgi:hypothetical protein
MNSSSGTGSPAKRRGILFKLGVVGLFLVTLLVVAYFVVTSGAFFTGFILPRVSRAANAQVTVTGASISPWSEVVLDGLKVVPNGQEQLLQVGQIRARYSLWDIIRGHIVVNEASVTDLVLTLVQNADGSSNLDPITKGRPAAAAAPPPPKPSGGGGPLPALDVQNIGLKNVRVEITQNLKGGLRRVIQVAGFDLAVDQIKNSQPGKLTYSANLAFQQSGTNAAAIEAALRGAFGFAVGPNLEPLSISGNTRIDVSKASGVMSNLAGFGVALDCDLSPTEIRKANTRLEQSGNLLGELRVGGPFVLATKEGHLKAELASVDQRVLNMVGAPMGLAFNQTTLSSTNDIDLKKGGAAIAVSGQFKIGSLSVTRTAAKQTTPTLDLQLAYQVDVDQGNKTVLVKQFDVNGAQNQKPMLHTALTKVLAFNWGGSAGLPEEASLDLVVTGLNLADWKAFAADLAPTGSLDSKLHVVSTGGGKQFAVDLSARLSEFGARFGSNSISRADVDLGARVQVVESKKVTLQDYSFQLAHQGVTAVRLSGSGTINTETQDAEIKALLQAEIPELLHMVTIPDVNASAGSIRFDGQIAQGKGSQAVVGSLALTGLSGHFAKCDLDRLQTKSDLDVTVRGDDLQLNKFSGTLQHAGLPGGGFDAGGSFNKATKVGQISFTLSDLNQNLLKPFLTPSLGGQQLVSVAINANARASMDPGGKASLQGDFGVTNLVVRAPDQSSAPAPLSAKFKLDGSWANQQLELRQCQIALSPTARGKNQIDIKGQADLSKTNALAANFSLLAESIDVTPFYDMMTGSKPTSRFSGAQPKPSAAPAQTAAPQVEPDPLQLPIKQVTVNLNIDRFYLRELEITNWQAALNLQGSHVVVKPLQLVLNGGPVTSSVDADLGVRGYTYQFSLSMDKVPLEPLVNSFQPENRGACKGTFLADTQIKGAGVTGASLRKNLEGYAAFSLTNAAISLTNLSAMAQAGLPGFARPIGSLLNGGVIAPLLPAVAAYLKTPDLLQDPVNSISSSLSIGQGKIALQTCRVASQAFISDTHGDIQIADVLSDSALNLPMSFSLRQQYVKNVPYLATSVSQNAGYADLPDLVKVGGTLGRPRAQMADMSQIVKSLPSILKGLGGQPAPQSNPATTTNNAAPAKPAIGDLLNNFLKKK